jgi:hypothetical protein
MQDWLQRRMTSFFQIWLRRGRNARVLQRTKGHWGNPWSPKLLGRVRSSKMDPDASSIS